MAEAPQRPDDRVVILPAWLDPPALPGLRYVFWDSGQPLPAEADLARATYFVPPYMGPAADVALAGRMPQLEVVQALMAGTDAMAEVVPPGVSLRRATGVHDDSTAELAVGLMIASQRGLDIAARDMPAHQWRHFRRPALADSRIALLGWGGVGRAIADRLAGFAVDVSVFARTGRDGVLPVAELMPRLGEFDIVVLALPLTDQTRGMCGPGFLAAMADGALLVNVGRGPLVDTRTLVEHVRSGRLRAALDVTDPEPLPPEHPLWSLPGVLITPHLGGDSEAFVPRARRFIAAQLAEYAVSGG